MMIPSRLRRNIVSKIIAVRDSDGRVVSRWKLAKPAQKNKYHIVDREIGGARIVSFLQNLLLRPSTGKFDGKAVSEQEALDIIGRADGDADYRASFAATISVRRPVTRVIGLSRSGGRYEA